MEVIKVNNVYKSFKVYYDKGSTLKEKVLFKNRNRHEVHEVLKGVSITINKGEVVGLLGENGCGKSTLLKLMTKIIYPNSGDIEIKGKVSSLLELGAGFHPDMTGRENIYNNASIFGLSKKQIDERLDEIIEFSELGEFIDNPVRTYSSGMYMRLAFSVAINVNADILLIDEILAVGDAAFQAKCFNKMQEIKNEGKTIVIVSHDTGSIERLCNRAIWIDQGKKKVDGVPHDVVALYLDKIMNKQINKTKFEDLEVGEDVKSENKESNDEKINDEPKEDKTDLNRTGNKYIEIESIKMHTSKNDTDQHNFKTEDKVHIKIKYKRNNKSVSDAAVGIGIFRIDGLNCYGTNTYIDNREKLKMNDEGTVEVILDEMQLLEGNYLLDIAFHDEYGTPYDYIRKAKEFNIYSSIKDTGVFRIKHEFKVK